MTKKAFDTIAEKLFSLDNIPPKDTEVLLTLIEAHPELLALDRVTNNLLLIFPFLRDVDSDRWSQEQIDALLSVCRSLIKNQNTLCMEFKRFAEAAPGKFGPFHGDVPNHPLYISLWLQPPEGHPEGTFHHLQAHFMNAFFWLRIYELRQDKIYNSIITRASTSLRQIVFQKRRAEILAQLPPPPCSIDILADFLQAQVADLKHQKRRSEDFECLEQLLAYALGERGGYTRKRYSGSNAPAEIITISNDETEDSTPETYTLVRQSAVTKDEANAAFRAGCAPGETYSGPTMIFEGKPVDFDKGESLVSLIIKTRNKYRHLANGNQRLPQRWNRINFQDTFHLFRFMEDFIQDKNADFFPTNQNEEEFKAFLSVMYWTSSPVTRAINTLLCTSIQNLPAKLPDNTVIICLKEKCWAIKSLKLEQRRKGKASWEKLFEKVSPYIILPIGNFFWENIKQWIALREQSITRDTVQLFEWDKEEKSSLNKIISQINNTSNTRLTLTRISAHLHHLFGDQTGDPADAAYVFSKIPPAGQQNALYYYAPEIHLLQKLYAKTCYDIENAIMSHWGKKNTQPPYIRKQTGRIGTHMCPLKETVTLMVKDLQAQVSYFRKERFSPQSIINFHNAYTTYCVYLVGFSTGYRAVRDPFYSLDEIDLESGFAVISDKDNDDQYNSRLVWLPLVCLDQLKAYMFHRQALIDQLILINPGIARDLKWDDDSLLFWKGRKRALPAKPFFLYLNKSGRPEDVRESRVLEHTPWKERLPLNINRHYLRTHLRKQMVHGEIVDAYMGHWTMGTESFGKNSTLSPLDFRDTLSGPLTKILKRDGWKVIEGIR